MAAVTSVIFFGDHSIEPYDSLNALIEESKSSYLLEEFLRASWKLLDCEAKDLPYSQSSALQCTSFSDLSANLQKNGQKCAAVSNVLGCTAQIGWAILVLGLCSGTIPAIAASIASSAWELAEIGPEFVLLSLRMGLEIAKRSMNIDQQTNESWSVAVLNMDPKAGQTQLESFCHSEAIPVHRCPYISLKASSSFTASGPPSVLESFLSTKDLASARKLAIPIWGAYHAPHLPIPDIDKLIPSSELWDKVVPVNFPLLHTKRRDNKTPPSLKFVIKEALYDIFQTPISLEETCETLKRCAGDREIQINVLGPGRPGKLFDEVTSQETIRFGSGSDAFTDDLPSNREAEGSIAIIGMAGKFPEAEDVDDLWNIIMEGRDLHREIPSSRFDVRTHCDPTGKVKNTSLTPYGCFYDNIDKFDLPLFKMSPREASQTDPMQRLMLLTAFMALESAGYYDPGPKRTRPKFGTYYGQGGDDYRQVNSGQDVDNNYITGGIRAFGPGRVSYHFGWEGPSMTVDTACSASAVAIHQAVSALRLRECNTALAGGANFLSCSDMFAGLSRASFLSLTGGCKTLDEKADGYCRADAVATVVLKRLEDAKRDNDNILGVIRSIETNHAANAISITHPHADTQAALFESVIRSAGLSADDIDHVETHGTGTQAGDVAETTSIASLLRGKRRPDSHPLYIGAVKPNVGHSEAASGVTSLIKGVLMMQNKFIPQHTGVKNKLNPKFPSLDALNIRVPNENVPYKVTNRLKKRRMLINNFNATGGSTALLLEEYDKAERKNEDPRGSYPICLSAATSKSLRKSIENLRAMLLVKPEALISHLSYSLTARRMHHAYRFSCAAASVPELKMKLETALSSNEFHRQKGEAPTIVFVFTGQASQYAGMGYTLWETCQIFRRHIETSDRICTNLGFPQFGELIKNPGADKTKFDTVQSQLALVALEVALANTLQAWNVQATSVIGHSLGEYSALHVAGVISLVDMFYLVGTRAQLMAKKCESDYSMLAVEASSDEAQDSIKSNQLLKSVVACINGPNQTVISGPNAEIRVLKDHFLQKETKSTVLNTRHAFHSTQMDPILVSYKDIAKSVEFRVPQIPVASCLLGKIVNDDTRFDADYLVRQTREPVQFVKALQAMQSLESIDDSTVWVELGPTATCLSMVSSVLSISTSRLTAILDKRKSNWQTMSDAMARIYGNGSDPFWDEYHKEYLNCLRFIKLPGYCFDLTSHFIPYEGNWAVIKNQKSINDNYRTEHILRSTTLHQISKDVIEQGIRAMTFISDLSQKTMQELITSSDGSTKLAGASFVLTDMVLSAAEHLWQTERPAESLPPVKISISGPIEVSTRAILSGRSVKIIARRSLTDNQVVDISMSVDTSEAEHFAQFKIFFDTKYEWAKVNDKIAYLYKYRLDMLQDGVIAGQTKKLALRDSAELLMADSDNAESIANIKLNKNPGHFSLDPNWQEQLFNVGKKMLMLSQGSFETVHFHGWHNIKILRKLQPGSLYHVHARLQPSSTEYTAVCDIHVLDSDNRIVAILEDVEYSLNDNHSSLSARNITLDLVNDGTKTPGSTHGSLTESLMDSTKTFATSTPTDYMPTSPKPLEFGQVVAIMASEIGIDPSFIHEDSLFADLGVDSLLQIAIIEKVTAYLQRDLPKGILGKHNSLRKLRVYFADVFDAREISV